MRRTLWREEQRKIESRIERNGVLGYEEVLEEVELFLSALGRSFPEQPDQTFSQQLHQADINIQRLIQNATITENRQKNSLFFSLLRREKMYTNSGIKLKCSEAL